jgi:hypothetical protein
MNGEHDYYGDEKAFESLFDSYDAGEKKMVVNENCILCGRDLLQEEEEVCVVCQESGEDFGD